MLVFVEVSIDIFLLVAIVLIAALGGYMVNKAGLRKQKKEIVKLEVERLQNHAEILQLQKELTEKENINSQTPVFSIKDSSSDQNMEQSPNIRVSKKIAGGNPKSGS